jgi:hypothetical protein
MKNKNLLFICIIYVCSNVLHAQHTYGDGFPAFKDYPCVWNTLDTIQKYVPEIFPDSSGGLLLFFKFSDDGNIGLVDYIMYGGKQQDSVCIYQDKLLYSLLNSSELFMCSNNLKIDWFVIPVAIYHPVWESWYPGLRTIFENNISARNILWVLTNFNSSNVLPTYFAYRPNLTQGCPIPPCE